MASQGYGPNTKFDASAIISGTLDAARLPGHSAALLTSGTLAAARLPAATNAALGAVLMAEDLTARNDNTGGTAQAAWAAPAALYNSAGEANFRATVAEEFLRIYFTLRAAGVMG